MPDDEIKALRQQVAQLQKQVAEIRHNLIQESWNTTANLKKLHEYIRDIYDHLWPVVRKVFPNYTKDLRAIDDFLKGQDSRSAGRGRPKS
jgi:uncharacterized membrane-anchored protein YhcB (DUF1043 family)